MHFFCTYCTSIYISRRLCFFFLSFSLFFPIVACPIFLFCSFSSVSFPFSLSLFFLHYYQHRESIKEFVCFPFVFGPNFFFFFFFSLFFYLSTLARVDVFADAKCARTHTAYRKKKTEGEEDEQTYTIEKKRVMLSLNTILPFFPLFFNLRPVTAIYIYI